MAQLFADAGHEVTFISRRWPGLCTRETEGAITHVRLRGFRHTRFLAVNLALDFLWGISVTIALPTADAVICNTVSLPIWLHFLRPSSGKVCVVMGRAPKGQLALYGGVRRIYAPSQALAEAIGASFEPSRVRVIGNPIDWSGLAGASAQGAGPVTIGFVGRLHPEKGLSLLLAAGAILAKRAGLPDWRVRVVGPHRVEEGGGGQQWFDSVKRAADLELGGRIEWVGAEFDSHRLALLYGSMDIFCYPSLAEKGETFGVAVAEAMSARCAVVVSDLACFGDLVQDGLTGMVFDHRGQGAEVRLAACLEALVKEPPRREAMAASGQAHARCFDFSEVSRTVLDDLAFLARTGHEKP